MENEHTQQEEQNKPLPGEEAQWRRHILRLARERFEQPQNGSQLLKREDLLKAVGLPESETALFDQLVFDLGADGYLHLVGQESLTRPFTFTRLTRKGAKYLARLDD